MRCFALVGLLVAGAGIPAPAAAEYVDPPGRVAYLAHSQGEIGFAPAGEEQWLQAARNRPLYRGDRLWSGRRSRAELQVGSAAVRMGEDTGLEILDLDNDIAQFQLTQGSLNLRVRELYRGQSYEVDTPTLAFVIREPGRYRIDIDPQGAGATVIVWEGAAEAYGASNRFPLRAGDAVRFYDDDLRDYEMLGVPRGDAFDRYCIQRDRRLDGSESLRYLGHDVAGYAELDDYGSWRQERGYGNVWYPDQVRGDWAPYREGHWVWQEPWGWTWVDDAPWGFAPSHYGRWAHVDNRWGWVPGPRNVRPVYAPALVAFVGGSGWSLSISSGNASSIGWFPLGPREVYVPSYRASRGYFNNVNASNTQININNVTNIYNNYSRGDNTLTRVPYANRAIDGAVTAVPGDVFVNARPVRQSRIRVDGRSMEAAQVSRIATIAPSARSVMGPGAASRNQPAARAFQREVVARHAPPAQQQPFAARQQQLQRNAGQAPALQAAQANGGRANGARQNVRVIAQQQAATDARAAGTRRDGEPSPGKPDRQAQPQPQDRGDDTQRAPRPSQDNGRQPVRQPYEREPAASGRQAQTEAGKPADRVQAAPPAAQPAAQDAAQRRQAAAARQPVAVAPQPRDAGKEPAAASERQSRQRDNGVPQPNVAQPPPNAGMADDRNGPSRQKPAQESRGAQPRADMPAQAQGTGQSQARARSQAQASASAAESEARASAEAEARALSQPRKPDASAGAAATPVDDSPKKGARKQRDRNGDEIDPETADESTDPRGRKDRD